MTSLAWCYVAAAGWVLAAVLALLGGARPAGQRVCCLLSALAGAAAIAGGVSSLLWGNSRVVSLGGTVVVGTVQLQASSLARVFTALLGLVALALALYVRRYRQPGTGSALYLGVYNLALVAALAVFTAGNVVTFLVAWETVALLCYLLILRHPRRTEVASGAFWFLVLSEAGFVFIVAAWPACRVRAQAATQRGRRHTPSRRQITIPAPLACQFVQLS